MNKSEGSKNGRIKWNLLIFFMIAAFSLGACAKKQVVKKTPLQNPAAESKIENGDQVQSEELDIHGKDFQSSKNLQKVHFEFDSSRLSDQDRNILYTNAGFLKENPDTEVLVEGHCDQRGTVGFNLALGERRAKAVREYYAALGIQPKRIGTISYGKEIPLCIQNTENCWSENRRAETKVRTLKVASDGNQKRAIIK